MFISFFTISSETSGFHLSQPLELPECLEGSLVFPLIVTDLNFYGFKPYRFLLALRISMGFDQIFPSGVRHGLVSTKRWLLVR